MPYHTPDFIWEVFGAPDFESYAEAFVVEGRFHRDVPEAVRESYAVAEQIMAHACSYGIRELRDFRVCLHPAFTPCHATN